MCLHYITNIEFTCCYPLPPHPKSKFLVTCKHIQNSKTKILIDNFGFSFSRLLIKITNCDKVFTEFGGELPAQNALGYRQKSVQNGSSLPAQWTGLFLNLIQNLQGKQENPLQIIFL